VQVATERSHLPSPIEPGEHRQLIATERLHNQVVDYMKSTGAGFTRDAVNTVGEKVARTLRGALWYIDTAHQQFEERAIHLYRCSYDLCWFCILWICKSFMQECIILWICKLLVQECMFFEVGSFVLYFQVVFILKILSGQSPFDFFFFWSVTPFLSCKDPSNKN